MKMNRRGFLGAILVAGVAPAIMRADALMRVIPRRTLVYNLGDLELDGELLRYGTDERIEVYRLAGCIRLPTGSPLGAEEYDATTSRQFEVL